MSLIGFSDSIIFFLLLLPLLFLLKILLLLILLSKQFNPSIPKFDSEYFVKFKLFNPLIDKLCILLEGWAPVDLPECLFPEILADLSNPASTK